MNNFGSAIRAKQRSNYVTQGVEYTRQEIPTEKYNTGPIVRAIPVVKQKSPQEFGFFQKYLTQRKAYSVAKQREKNAKNAKRVAQAIRVRTKTLISK